MKPSRSRAMDHYKALGLNKNATKDEIKQAFRELALKFHPDKHSLSSEEVKERAAARFMRATEAYEVLIDDGKRADYNRRSSSFSGGSGKAGSYGYSYNRSSYQSTSRPNSRRGLNFDAVFRFLTSRGFLLNTAFASIILGGAVVIERSGEKIWKMQNSGKSFEEALESIQKSKVQQPKDNS
ncbi:chaperone protein dnaJ 72-like [Aristolochia californica]|uniref:chaperone protein dnaJ 72-like n=1 Tax=Aristolochia californica TaxID=171875 RepID=UPI0035D8D31A